MTRLRTSWLVLLALALLALSASAASARPLGRMRMRALDTTSSSSDPAPTTTSSAGGAPLDVDAGANAEVGVEATTSVGTTDDKPTPPADDGSTVTKPDAGAAEGEVAVGVEGEVEKPVPSTPPAPTDSSESEVDPPPTSTNTNTEGSGVVTVTVTSNPGSQPPAPTTPSEPAAGGSNGGSMPEEHPTPSPPAAGGSNGTPDVEEHPMPSPPSAGGSEGQPDEEEHPTPSPPSTGGSEGNPEPDTPPTPTPAPTQFDKDCDKDANDLVALNYALALEHLEAAFYTEAQNMFSANDFKSIGLGQEIYDHFDLIYQHELAHVTALKATITNHGGEPCGACEYRFGLTDVQSYITIAKVLENTGVSAYDGAINALSDTGLQQVAATIATVEARHAAFLNELNSVSPFPDATDSPKTPSEIIAAVTPFIVSCPKTIVAPTVRPGGVSFSASLPAPPPQSSNPPRGTYTAEQAANDGLAANYALTLEHLEATFYTQGMAKFNAAAFAAAGFNKNVYDNFVLIGAHETAHVNALTNLITSRGGTAVPACEYNFDLSSVATFVATAQVLENTGVSAYDGAVNTIADVGVQQSAACIATVEARHAAYLNRLNKAIPFPADFDEAKTPAQIVLAITPLIKSCPFTIKVPVVATPAECAPVKPAQPTTPAQPTKPNTPTTPVTPPSPPNVPEAPTTPNAPTPTTPPAPPAQGGSDGTPEPVETPSKDCKLSSLSLGSGFSYFPDFSPSTYQYYCSCATTTFLGSVTAASDNEDVSITATVNGGQQQVMVNGVESASYNMGFGDNSIAVVVKGTGDAASCTTTYTLDCTRAPAAGAAVTLYNWETSAFGECSSRAVCLTRVGTVEGTHSRTVTCVNDSGAKVADSFCDAASRPPTEAVCKTRCQTQERADANADVTINQNAAAGLGASLFVVLAAAAMATMATLQA